MNDRLLEEARELRTIPSGSNLSIKKILVAVDLSPHSEKTAAYAAEFAAHFSASLTLVHVCSPKDATEITGSTDSRFGDPVIAPQKELENLAREVRKTYPSCTAYLYVGDPADKIVQLAQTLNADLILTGNQHPSFLGRLLGLDQPSRIVHRAPCPILIYRDGK